MHSALEHNMLLKRGGLLTGFGASYSRSVGMEQEIDVETVFPFLKEPIELIMGELVMTREWSFEKHSEFHQDFQQSVLTFLLSLKRKIPQCLKPPKFVLSLIINLTI